MYHLQIAYPAALAATNAGVGWVLYRALDPILGAALLVVGSLVFLTLVVRTARAIGRGSSVAGLDPS
jgi:hypothetical protein